MRPANELRKMEKHLLIADKALDKLLKYAEPKEAELLKIKTDDPLLKKGQAVIKSLIRSRARIRRLKTRLQRLGE